MKESGIPRLIMDVFKSFVAIIVLICSPKPPVITPSSIVII